jgi:aspartyl/asparaginyl beta-hydroxylase (cupin superfamily)
LQLIQPSLRISQPERKGCPQILPNLRSFPFWDSKEFPWIEKFQSFLPEIQKEFFQLKNITIQQHHAPATPSEQITSTQGSQLKCGFQRYSSPKTDFLQEKEEKEIHETIILTANDDLNYYDNATNKGSWNVCYFNLNGITFEENIKNCPKTMEAIR